MLDNTVILMMIVSACISVTMLVLVLIFAKNSYFEDPNKSHEYPLFDSTSDLNEAIEKEEKTSSNNKHK